MLRKMQEIISAVKLSVSQLLLIGQGYPKSVYLPLIVTGDSFKCPQTVDHKLSLKQNTMYVCA